MSKKQRKKPSLLNKNKDQEIGTLEQYKDKGKDICKKYCEFKNQYPIMLPPAPKQTYIDVYIDEEGASSSKFDYEKRLQDNYEVEVEVYRALEKVPENFVVLHGFEYTHQQYRICDKSHDRKNCKLCKGKAADKTECDFVVIGKNYVVIIEVKNVPIDEDSELTEEQRKQLTGTFAKSRDQLERTKSLINGLLQQVFVEMEVEQCSIICLSAFPSTSRDLFQNMDEQTKKQILCKEDFLDFSSWWKKHDVLGSISSFVQTEVFLAKYQEIKQVLVAMYCTDKRLCNELKCSLGQAILDIDDELKKGNITFLSKKRAQNPNVINVSNIVSANVNQNGIVNIFKDMLGIEYLTAEQHDAFNRDQNLLVINGPAGSGKTIILLAKIIHLIMTKVEIRVILFISALENNSCKRYQNTLNKANITNTVVEEDWRDSTDVTIQKISDSKQNGQVVIVRMELVRSNSLLEKALGDGGNTHVFEGGNTHVFVDDSQTEMYQHVDSPAELMRRLTEVQLSCWVWIGCDLSQKCYLSHAGFLQNYYEPVCSLFQSMLSENIVNLSLNLRNTCDIADCLSKVREHLIPTVPEEETADLDVVFPVLQPGHFIHGPRTVVHVIDKAFSVNSAGLIANTLNMELDKLYDPCVLRGFQIGIIGDSCDKNVVKMIESAIEKRSNLSGVEIDFCDAASCHSVEYPAVIVLHDVSGRASISSLYLEISRARVYCAVIIYSSNKKYSSENRLLRDLLNKIEDNVRILKQY
ncbi:uncharacterized protein LOC134824719 [Bolinopsis microptera]|uniref:uncharacterized protein LOC134824719 n=1 Tax=Bolinopsis microptera TaxID=2820187 RepID=UPI003079EB28